MKTSPTFLQPINSLVYTDWLIDLKCTRVDQYAICRWSSYKYFKFIGGLRTEKHAKLLAYSHLLIIETLFFQQCLILCCVYAPQIFSLPILDYDFCICIISATRSLQSLIKHCVVMVVTLFAFIRLIHRFYALMY